MTTRDRLHRWADVLPEAELDTAERVLAALAGARDPAAYTALLAPDDDEPLTDAERAGMAEGRADLAAGRVHTAAEVRAALGLDRAR
jgi:predicted transcriptional regulator